MSDKIRILVVDHDPDVLLATSRLLKEAGYEVLEASTGKECLDLARQRCPDLVFPNCRGAVRVWPCRAEDAKEVLEGNN